MITSNKFELGKFRASLSFLRLAADYPRIFTTGGKPANLETDAPIWVQVNQPAANTPNKKANNRDITTLSNVTLDFEYPSEPSAAHTLGMELADCLVSMGLAESGLPVEDSGAGCHIVIPIVPFDVASSGGGELVNRAVATIVSEYIKPEFDRLAQLHGLTGKIKLEGFDISRILSVPGTWRPGGSKPNEAEFLKDGYLRRWLAPFDGSNYPQRNESESLAELIRAVAINLEKPALTTGQSRPQTDASSWLSDYASRKNKTGDRSTDFHALVTACYLRYDAQIALDNAGIIDDLTGNKYGPRAAKEAARSIRKAERLPKISPENWYSSLGYHETHQAGNRAALFPSAAPNPAPTLKQHHLTDLGNARRLVERFGQDLRFVNEWGWLVWSGQYWELDKSSSAKRLAKKTVASIYTEAGQEEDADKRKAIASWAAKSEASGKLAAMLELAESEFEIVARPEQFDLNPWVINCLNGTLDLKTGQLKPHSRADLITKLAPVNYDPTAECFKWLNFLDTIMGGNQELVKYLQRAIGYSLTGDTTEHCLFFCYGTGRNGKSTFLETISNLLGDYAQASSFNTFLERNSDGPRNDIAKLAGARFVSATEADPGKRLAEGVIKQLTGGDTISARFLFKEEFSFRPAFKLFLAANHRPPVRGQDEGIWRRIRLIPFEVTIPENKVDKRLTEKLKAELAGILAWAVQGCLEWQKLAGLAETAEIKAATASYREESDVLRDFIAECCVIDRSKSIAVAKLYPFYAEWCKEAGENPISKRAFSSCLAERNIPTATKGGNVRHYAGITLFTEFTGKE